MTINRRRLLQHSTSLLAFGLLGGLAGCGSLPKGRRLKTDPNRVLNLPQGFSYKVLQRKGSLMSDGYDVPGRPDGMGSFQGKDGSVILMRNHELDEGQSDFSPYFSSQSKQHFYDQEGYGAVSRLVIDPQSLKVISSNLVLAGSSRNCAGGLSPWGWVSCEETLDHGHGFAFLCSHHASELAQPQPLKSFGRFNHEAFAFHPQTAISYQTEDRGDGCFYRFVPDDKQQPFGKGLLQALSVSGFPELNTSLDIEKETEFAVDWVSIDEPVPENDNCRFQGRDKGAASFSRGEGLWLHDNELYFSATNGGLKGKGQIFQLKDLDKPGNKMKLICEAEGRSSMESPDNLAVAPWGDLVVAEDGKGVDYIRIISRKGKIVTLARNVRSSSEIAGVNFSPDGRLLFLNLQEDGLTIAIKGPFAEYAETGEQMYHDAWTQPF